MLVNEINMDERKEKDSLELYISLPSRRTKCIRIVVSLHNAIQHPVQTDFRFKIDRLIFPDEKNRARRKQSLPPQISVTTQKRSAKMKIVL